jgi:hypothetical protein
MTERKIITMFNEPPIPSRHWDWQATEEGFDYGDSVGYGSTEQEAIDDLIGQLDEPI